MRSLACVVALVGAICVERCFSFTPTIRSPPMWKIRLEEGIGGAEQNDIFNQTDVPMISKPHPGYMKIAGFGWYKIHGFSDRVNWSMARAICKQEGADLIVINSDQKRDIAFKQLRLQMAPWTSWVGVHDPGHNKTWISVHGEPVPTSWWARGQPRGTGRCALAGEDGLLFNHPCDLPIPFICELNLD